MRKMLCNTIFSKFDVLQKLAALLVTLFILQSVQGVKASCGDDWVVLDYSGCNITSASQASAESRSINDLLGELKKNTRSERVLDLSANKITAECLPTIREIVEFFPLLETVNLSGNQISQPKDRREKEIFAMALHSILYKPSLKYLDITNNQIINTKWFMWDFFRFLSTEQHSKLICIPPSKVEIHSKIYPRDMIKAHCVYFGLETPLRKL